MFALRTFVALILRPKSNLLYVGIFVLISMVILQTKKKEFEEGKKEEEKTKGKGRGRKRKRNENIW